MTKQELREVFERCVDDIDDALATYVSVQLARKKRPDGTLGLTVRERKIYELVVRRGLQNKQIAELLHITTHTVKFHVANILRRMECSNRAELIRKSLE